MSKAKLPEVGAVVTWTTDNRRLKAAGVKPFAAKGVIKSFSARKFGSQVLTSAVLKVTSKKWRETFGKNWTVVDVKRLTVVS